MLGMAACSGAGQAAHSNIGLAMKPALCLLLVSSEALRHLLEVGMPCLHILGSHPP